MAEKKTIELEVVSNSQNVQQQFKELRSTIKSTTEQIEELSKEFGENSNEVQVAKKQLNELKNSYSELSKSATDLGATFEQVYGEIQPLTARMGEAEDRLYELAAAGKQGTREYRDLLKEVGKYKRVQMETDMTVDAASSTMANKLVGALGGAAAATEVVTGAMGLFGVESEEVEKTLLKVQSAMALSQGVQGVIESAASFKTLTLQVKSFTIVQKVSTALQWLWNTAMKANPLMAIATAIIAVLAVGYKLISWLMESSEANKQAEASIKKNTDALNKQKASADRAGEALKEKNGHEYNMAKAAGKSAEALRKLALKHADEQVALEEASVATARNTYEKEKNTLAAYKMAGISDEVIQKQRELVTKTREALKEEYADLKEAYQNKRNVIHQNQVEIQQELTDAKKKEIELEKEKNDKIKDQQKDAHDKAVEALEEIKKNNRDATDVFKAEYDKQVRDVKEKYDAQIALAKKYKKDTADLEAAKAKELKDLEDHQIDTTRLGLEKVSLLEAKHIERSKESQEQQKKGLVGVQEARERIAEAEKKLSDEEIANAKKKNDLTVQGAKDSLQMIADLTTLFAGKSKKQQERAFKIQKAVNIANAIVDTYKAANSALASAPPPFNFIAMGAAITAGLVNVKKISDTKFEGGATPSSGGGDTSSGGMTGGSVMSPSFNVVGNSGINQLAQLQQQPTKAYVVSGDVTSAQSLDRNRIENATLVK